MRTLAATILALLVLPRTAPAADLTFTGGLRFVRPEFLTIRLADGRVISARLPKTPDLTSAAITAKYRIADQVQITCKPISIYWDKVANRYHSLELTALRFLAAPSPEEVARVNASISWEGGDNLLKPSAVVPPPKPPPAAVPAGFERIRAINLDRAAKLPTFTADEIATRSELKPGSTKWRQVDIVESEITFLGAQGGRQNIRINGKPFKKEEGGWIPGVNWGLGFGGELKPLFDRDCANAFTFEGRQELRGKPVLAYAFSAPQDGCFDAGTTNYQQYSAARSGRILVEDPEGNVIQMEHETHGTPSEFTGEQTVTLSWDYVKIGDATHLLPVAADYIDRFSKGGFANGAQWHIAVQYKNHRHFEASTNVTFQEPPPAK
jgi:hypothetical protein